MKRRSVTEDGSLDLLLDTICNAFGGIVFIALLLAVITQQMPDQKNGHYSEGHLPPSVLELRANIRMVKDEVKRLREQVEESQTSEIQNPTSDIAREYAALQAQALLLGEKHISTLQEETRTRSEIRQAESAIRTMKNELAQMSKRIKSIQEARTETVSLPVSRPSPAGMGQFWVFVQKGRLHLVSSLQPGKEYDSGVVMLEETSSYEAVTVEDQNGQRLTKGSERSGALAEFLRRTSPDRIVIQVMLDKASFKEFNYFKKVLVENGYRYFFHIGTPPVRFSQGSDFENF